MVRLWVSVAFGLLLRGRRAPCSCACCSTFAEDEAAPPRCGVPVFEPPDAHLASCPDKCTADGNFVLHSSLGNEFELERFCFHACEPAAAATGGACQPLTEATVARTYANTTHSLAFSGTDSAPGAPVGNGLGNGAAPVLRGDPVLPAAAAGFACALFPPARVCHDSGSLTCTVSLSEFNGPRTCAGVCAARKLRCLRAWSGETCPQNATAMAPEALEAPLGDPEEVKLASPVLKHAGGKDFSGPTTACRHVAVGDSPESLAPVTWCECAVSTARDPDFG